MLRFRKKWKGICFCRIGCRKIEVLKDVLAQDPRPHYQKTLIRYMECLMRGLIFISQFVIKRLLLSSRLLNIVLQTYFAKLSKRTFLTESCRLHQYSWLPWCRRYWSFDSDIVYHTFCTMCFYTCFATSYVDVAHVDVLKVWQEFLFYRSGLFLGTYVVIKIGGLEGYGCILDIGHINMVDIDVSDVPPLFTALLKRKPVSVPWKVLLRTTIFFMPPENSLPITKPPCAWYTVLS